MHPLNDPSVDRNQSRLTSISYVAGTSQLFNDSAHTYKERTDLLDMKVVVSKFISNSEHHNSIFAIY